jgi:hypothetical protein
VKNEKELRILWKKRWKTNIFHSFLFSLYSRAPPHPLLSCLAHFNIWFFAKNIAKKPTTHFTKFFIIMFLILQGFIEIIAKHLPQYKRQKTVRN